MITHVAINASGKVYALPRPKRHHDVLWYMAEMDVAMRTTSSDARHVQGFLDDKGNFLDRVQALAHALQHNQHKTPDDHFPQLYSEDLW